MTLRKPLGLTVFLIFCHTISSGFLKPIRIVTIDFWILSGISSSSFLNKFNQIEFRTSVGIGKIRQTSVFLEVQG